jgi:hypothetical protein
MMSKKLKICVEVENDEDGFFYKRKWEKLFLAAVNNSQYQNLSLFCC